MGCLFSSEDRPAPPGDVTSTASVTEVLWGLVGVVIGILALIICSMFGPKQKTPLKQQVKQPAPVKEPVVVSQKVVPATPEKMVVSPKVQPAKPASPAPVRATAPVSPPASVIPNKAAKSPEVVQRQPVKSVEKAVENEKVVRPSLAKGGSAVKFAPDTKSTSSGMKGTKPVPLALTGRSQTVALLDWCKKCTADYSSQGVNIVDFTKSWQDGKAFMAMLHHFRPDLIDWKRVSSKPIENLEYAFTQAEKAGVSKLLDAEDIAICPERLSIITYVTMYLKEFNSA